MLKVNGPHWQRSISHGDRSKRIPRNFYKDVLSSTYYNLIKTNKQTNHKVFGWRIYWKKQEKLIHIKKRVCMWTWRAITLHSHTWLNRWCWVQQFFRLQVLDLCRGSPSEKWEAAREWKDLEELSDCEDKIERTHVTLHGWLKTWCPNNILPGFLGFTRCNLNYSILLLIGSPSSNSQTNISYRCGFCRWNRLVALGTHSL